MLQSRTYKQWFGKEKKLPLPLKCRNKCLKSWHNLREKFLFINLVQIIDHFLAEQHVTLLTDKCERIEKYARALSSSAKSKLFGKRGRQFTNHSNQFRRIHVLQNEAIKSQNLKQLNQNQRLDLAEQYQAISERYEELSESIKSMEDEKCKTDEKLAKQVETQS